MSTEEVLNKQIWLSLVQTEWPSLTPAQSEILLWKIMFSDVLFEAKTVEERKLIGVYEQYKMWRALKNDGRGSA
jgi:hypothetical protein